MPRKAVVLALSAQRPAPGGVAAVDRALSLLEVFTTDSPNPTLAELAERTRQYKSTVLRLLASLQHAGLVQRQADGRYVVGTAITRLHRVFSSSRP